MSEYPSDKEIERETRLQHTARDPAQIVRTRQLIWITTVMSPVLLTFVAWVGLRLVTQLDHVADKQETFSMDVATIKAQLPTLIENQRRSEADINRRISEANTNNDSRFNAQANWVQRLSDKIDKFYMRGGP